MKIVFTRNGKSAEIPLTGACTLKFYAVPEVYSSDGFFAAVWGPGELEPVPACPQADAELLAHLALAPGDEGGGLLLTKHYLRTGVTYAQN
ncbi:MAG: hypothetical protein LBO64_07220 [Desulfovibrio sp.]|jgi:hypothetical protein|nr:hypothetical protein [Desulfovibrio sp.]